MRGMLWVGLLFTAHLTFSNPIRLVFKVNQVGSNALKSENSDLFRFFKQNNLPIPVRIFPRHSSPDPKEVVLGRPLVDLSLLYEIELDSDLSTEFIIRKLQGFNEVIYAESITYDEKPLSLPNDPDAHPSTGSQRFVLEKIKAYQAWLTNQGDTSVSIALLDTGTPILHEEFGSQLFLNHADPPNGVDDDGNGLIDDYQGWDFGNNDPDPTPDNNGLAPGHGTSVSSLSSAAANNGIGVAGVAWKCKVLPLKIWRWNNGFSNFRGYEAIVYAADRGCKVINCSWGSARANRQYEQDIINYATFNRNALVVAAGGNTAGFQNFLPANYDYVVGVAMTDTLDRIVPNTSQQFELDVLAPGVGVFGIQTNGNFGWVDGGSSMAAPLVSGAAALIRSKWPQYQATQVGELLRVNTDTIYHLSGNGSFRDRAGRGRLNIEKAINRLNTISLRATRAELYNKFGSQAYAGDTLFLKLTFENYLDSVSSFSVRVSSASAYLSVIQGERVFGGMGPLSVLEPENSFVLWLNSNTPSESMAELLVEIFVGSQYYERKRFSFPINFPFLDLTGNQARLSLMGNGRLGFFNLQNNIGSGIRYKGSQLNGDAGLIVGTSASKVANNVFALATNDNHFKMESRPRFSNFPGTNQHAVFHINDSLAGPMSSSGLRIKCSAFQVDSGLLDGSIFLNYRVKNLQNAVFDSVCFGLYNDWEIENNNANFVEWIDSLKLGFTRGRWFSQRFAGVQILSEGEPQFYAIDALNTSANGNINLFDGFSKAEKWSTISSGVARTAAGQGSAGNNVVQVAGLKIRQLAPQEERKLAFAYVFADSLAELVLRAKANVEHFRRMNTSPSPPPFEANLCKGDTALVNVNLQPAVSRFLLFNDSAAAGPVFTGSTYQSVFSSDTTLWIAGADSLFQGPKVRFSWNFSTLPTAVFEVSPASALDSSFVDSVLNFQALNTSGSYTYAWYGPGNQQIGIFGSASYVPDSAGIHQVCLTVRDLQTGCQNTTCKLIKVVLPLSAASSTAQPTFFVWPNPSEAKNGFQVNSERGHLMVFNGFGSVVWQNNLEGGLQKVETVNWPKGVYTLRFTNSKGISFAKMIFR